MKCICEFVVVVVVVLVDVHSAFIFIHSLHLLPSVALLLTSWKVKEALWPLK